MSSNTRPSAALPAVPETTSLRIGGPAKSVSNHADRIEVLWQPETSAATTTNTDIVRKLMLYPLFIVNGKGPRAATGAV